MEESSFVMEDKKTVTTQIVPSRSSGGNWLIRFLTPMYENGNMIVGFDTEWSWEQAGRVTGSSTNKEARVGLLTLCNQEFCLIIKLVHHQYDELSKLFLNKDLVFAGINIDKDLEKLRKVYGLEIRNAVDLSKLTGHLVRQPLQSAYSVRRLATLVLHEHLKPRPLSMAVANWYGIDDLTAEQVESATGDAYWTYKIAEKLIN